MLPSPPVALLQTSMYLMSQNGLGNVVCSRGYTQLIQNISPIKNCQ